MAITQFVLFVFKQTKRKQLDKYLDDIHLASVSSEHCLLFTSNVKAKDLKQNVSKNIDEFKRILIRGRKQVVKHTLFCLVFTLNTDHHEYNGRFFLRLRSIHEKY
ncbi:CLUMA_CG009633, isoform A [Clunio marinus]|uniref:CLUMA_CG009633, isoform A n=1 Tax=Clunio marinus TaxID=568069 RepID=A0A1J1I7E5_9DIPT|nr:CLUMA_CG009633, isoform A [Clunio marinus]